MNNWARVHDLHDLRAAATAAFYDALPEELDGGTLTPAADLPDGQVQAVVIGHPMPGELVYTTDAVPVIVTAVQRALRLAPHDVEAAAVAGYRMDRPIPDDAAVCPIAEANAAITTRMGIDGGPGLLNEILWDPHAVTPALDDSTYDAEAHRHGTCACGWSPLVDGREALR